MFCWILFPSLQIVPSLLTCSLIYFFINHHSPSSTSVPPFPHVTHLSALCPSPSFLSLPSSFASLLLVVPHFTFLAFYRLSLCSSSSFLLVALLLSLCLSFLILFPSLFFSCLLVFVPHSLPPPQFKYRGHFLPISPGARRAPRFAARRKVPVWAAVSAVMSF